MEVSIKTFKWDEAVMHITCIKRAYELNQQRFTVDKDTGNTILHLAIRYQAPARVLEAIFQAGFTNINVPNTLGCRAVQYMRPVFYIPHEDEIECCLEHGISPSDFYWVLLEYCHFQLWLGSYGRIIRMLTRYGFKLEDHLGFFKKRDPIVRFAKRVVMLIPIVAAIQHKRVGAKSPLRVLPVELLRLLVHYI